MMSQKNIIEAVAMPSVLEVRGAKTADRVEWIDESSVRKKHAYCACNRNNELAARQSSPAGRETSRVFMFNHRQGLQPSGGFWSPVEYFGAFNSIDVPTVAAYVWRCCSWEQVK